jgi:hypothetical protein
MNRPAGIRNRYGASSRVLRSDRESLGKWSRTFRRIVLPLPSRVKQFKNLGLFDHKDSTTIWNVACHSPNDAAPHSTRPMATTPLWEFSVWDCDWILYIGRWILGSGFFRCPRHVDVSVFVYGKSHEIMRLFNLLTFNTQLLHIGTTVRVRATESHCAIGRSRSRSSRWQLSWLLSVLQKIPSGR